MSENKCAHISSEQLLQMIEALLLEVELVDNRTGQDY